MEIMAGNALMLIAINIWQFELWFYIITDYFSNNWSGYFKIGINLLATDKSLEMSLRNFLRDILHFLYIYEYFQIK